MLWIGQFEVTSRRVLTAWMDLFHHDTPEAETPQFIALLPLAAQQALQNIEDAEKQRQRLHAAHDEFVNVLRANHRGQFPLTDNSDEPGVLGPSRPERDPAGTVCDQYVSATD